ncbi:ParM/StbA family protein [Dendronalium sp. ChiSLP03b]|uniref:ParM/StbA family protein n=1 Tax=Dendronalium sp. ChiSLP03b TaxID=3075381 RepID=UPI002AD2592A|nr:ParM/StbA family protein [Dendronalium sp. ChiSLP03b]MDZ8208638.1 ParM/StbA family protein [Dendronalium sp. ChiSLP03b]
MYLLLALDPGTSLTKMIYRILSSIPYKPELFCMEPELISVTKESIDLYESGKINSPSPENESWIELEQEYYAVGFLAQKHFEARIKLSELKYENAIPKVLAAVGAIALREGLGNNFKLGLALLLPYGEWEDRERLERGLTAALSNFCFRGQQFSICLECFECKPEGGGLMLTRSKKLGADFNLLHIAVLMFGFRDISVVLFERGLSSGRTENLGLAWMLERIKNRTSGQNLQGLLLAIHQSGSTIKQKYFKSLARSRKAEFQADEITQIMEVSAMIRKEYCNKVADWLKSSVPSNVDLVIIGGGTAEYLSSELKALFSNAQISWAAELEEDVRQAFNLPPQKDALCIRMTDVYGLFRYLQSQVVYPPVLTSTITKEL